MIFSSAIGFSQVSISGIVVDIDNKPLIGANVTLQSDGNSGTVTDFDGLFELSVPNLNEILVISYTGYQTKTMAIDGQTNLRIVLDEGVELGEVVVTALGVTKDQRKVGYSVTTVDGGDMSEARETNVANSLTGRVAGLSVKSTSGGPGGTANILLRGMPSMNSAGSPLIVINGVPMDNTQRGSAGQWGGSDNGDGIGNLNPEDIDKMTVLKGQSASALYGARASNGVILITTKKGKKGEFSVDYNFNFMADQALDFTDFQYEYGQGTGGSRPITAADALSSTRLAWGEKLDGQSTIQFDGNSYPYSAQEGNIDRFYRTGTSITNSLAISKGGEDGAFRLSFSNLDNASIVDNSGLDRISINLNVDQNIGEKFSVSVLANYIDQDYNNRPKLSDGPLNPNNGIFLAPNIDQTILDPGFNPDNGYEIRWSDDEYVTNPYFVTNQFKSEIGRKRLLSAVSAKYDFADWIYAQARAGYDLINDRQFEVTPWGTAYPTGGSTFTGQLNTLARQQRSELNIDGLIGVSKPITSTLELDAFVGANLRKNFYETVSINGGPWVLPYLYSFNNVGSFGRGYDIEESEVQSMYYSIDFSYNYLLTLSTTGRYDTYSNLPSDNRSIFTPSVSASFTFGDLINMPSLTYGKLRASYAVTSGQPDNPYSTSIYYGVGNSINGIPTGNFGTGLPNLFLKPFTLTEIEVGADLKFLNNRLGVDISYFQRKSKNEIMNAQYSITTGYTSGVIANGSTQNTGLELLLSGRPVETEKFSWDVTLNLTSVANEILKTDENGNPINLGQNRGTLGNAVTAFVEGLPGPQIRAYDYKYDASGNIIVNEFGYPVRGELENWGSVLPKLYGGLNNQFSFGNFNLSFLVDYNFGNKILAATEYYSIFRGLHQLTLDGRENGITVGVLENGSVNTTAADPQGYYAALAQNVTSTSIEDGDFIKLRQFTAGYNIPKSIMNQIPYLSNIQISLVGRNLLTLMKKTDNIDPEASFGSNINYLGIEGTSLPTTRSYGLNARITFK
ncbi:SusC/RagA family TonB-linked outer membrane protein [Membranihabitans marinus]